jgi:polyisoprenoid-binding protein YceI
MRMFFILITAIIGFSRAVLAEPIDYEIITDKSTIGFTFQFGASEIIGAFPQYKENISIDFEKASNSHVDIVLGTATAKGGFVFATQALRSIKILNTSKFPDITFVSNSVQATKDGAMINGLITVRGITKPLILTARLMRAPGTQASERTNLHLYLTGEINRHDFGASGYPNAVGDIIAINVDAYIRRK